MNHANLPTENTTKQIRGTTHLLENVVASAPSKRSRKTSSRRLRAFATETAAIPHALHQFRPKAISLHDLADRLDVPPERLLPAIEHGYIRLITSEPPTVYEPPPAAIAWLKTMYAPLMLRPMVPAEMVAQIEAIDLPDVRRLCLAYDIPIQDDVVFGELLTLASFYKLHAQLHTYREPSRFDRQALVVALMQAVDPEKYGRDLKPPPYSKRLEKEIRRIAKMREPARTEFALRLVEAFGDAKSVTDCLATATGKPAASFREIEKAEKIVAVDEAVPPGDGLMEGI